MAEGKRDRILIVEDDVSLARIMGRLLESVGYDVSHAPTGIAALAYADEHAIDLVILDLRLPDMNGYEVCAKLRHEFTSWSLPIVMLTGMDKPVDQLRGFARGADAYLTKPCEPPELIKTIGLLLGQSTQS